MTSATLSAAPAPEGRPTPPTALLAGSMPSTNAVAYSILNDDGILRVDIVPAVHRDDNRVVISGWGPEFSSKVLDTTFSVGKARELRDALIGLDLGAVTA